MIHSERSPLLINSTLSSSNRIQSAAEVQPEIVRIVNCGNEQENEQTTFPMPNIPRLLWFTIDSETPLPLKTHTVFLKTYPNSFTGKEGVDWLLRFVKTRSNAIIVLQKLLDDGYVLKVTGQNNKRVYDNDDIYTLYQAKIRKDMNPSILSKHDFSIPTTTTTFSSSVTYQATQEPKSSNSLTVAVTSRSAPSLSIFDSHVKNEQNTQNQNVNVNISPNKSPKISGTVRNFLEIMRNNLSMIEKELPSTKERKQCFVARDGVTWMMKYRQLKEREHAVKILRRLLKKGLIIPLNPNQTEFTDNTTDFYYFLD